MGSLSIDVIRSYCGNIYADTYIYEKKRIEKEIIKNSKKGIVPTSKEGEIETSAQKEAIKKATIEGIKQFPNVEASLIWRAVYETHVHRKSGINDADTIAKVISADQSWKKSSGHAFEEMIKILGTAALHDKGIDIIYSEDFSTPRIGQAIMNRLIKAAGHRVVEV